MVGINFPKIINFALVWSDAVYSVTAYETSPLAGQAAPGTLDEISLRLPAGAYTTFRTYRHTCAIRFQDHLDRLADSAERASTPVNLHLQPLREALRGVVLRSPFPEARVRVSLDLTEKPGQLFVSLEALHLLPDQAYEQGVRAVSKRMHRDNPRAKLTDFIATAAGYRAQLPAGVNEMLMVSDEGIILEGLSSNFFGICEGVLHSANEGVLFGITRAVVLDLAQAREIPAELSGIRYIDWPTMDECFITSASRGVLSVIQIDDHVIGTGQPGVVTRQLMQAFADWVQIEAQEI